MKFKTRFTTLDEFYSALGALIERLEKGGYLEEAQKLSVAMAAGATGSEVLGELMLVLGSMKGKYPPALRKEINEFLEFARNHRKILRLDGR